MRMVSLLITLLVMAFIIIQLLGSHNSENKAATSSARMAEDKARTVEATILKSAQAQDHSLNSTEGGNNAAFNTLNQQTQQIQQGQQVQGAQSDNGQQQSQ